MLLCVPHKILFKDNLVHLDISIIFNHLSNHCLFKLWGKKSLLTSLFITTLLHFVYRQPVMPDLKETLTLKKRKVLIVSTLTQVKKEKSL